MSELKCERCNKIFTRKYNLLRHINRKIQCKVVENGNNPKIIPNNPKIIPKFFSENRKTEKKCKKNVKKNENIENNKIKCRYCNKLYASINGLYKHVNELRCKKIPLDKLNIVLQSKNNKVIRKKRENCNNILNIYQTNYINNTNCFNNLNHNITTNNNITHNSLTHNNVTNNSILNNTNNTTNNTTNNITIKINPFGQENTDFLTKKQKMYILNRQYMGVPELIKTIHEQPNNQNFFIPNLNKKMLAYLNNDNKIEYDNYDEICEKIINKNISRLDNFYEELQSELNENIKKQLDTIISKSNEGHLDEKYIREIKLYLINTSKRNKSEITNYIKNINSKLTSGK